MRTYLNNLFVCNKVDFSFLKQCIFYLREYKCRLSISRGCIYVYFDRFTSRCTFEKSCKNNQYTLSHDRSHTVKCASNTYIHRLLIGI